MKNKLRIKRRYSSGGYMDYMDATPKQNFANKFGKIGGAIGTGYYTSQLQQTDDPGEKAYNTGMAAVSQAGPIGGVIGGLSSLVNTVAQPIKQKAQQTDTITGGYKNMGAANRANIAQGMMDPYHNLTTVLNDPAANKKDRVMAGLNMAVPLVSLFSSKGYMKRKDKYLQEQKQANDWTNSINQRDTYRQSNPQYNYTPTFQDGGSVEVSPYFDYMDPRKKELLQHGIDSNYIYDQIEQDPEKLGSYFTLLKDENYKPTPYSQRFIINYNNRYAGKVDPYTGLTIEPLNPNKGSLSILRDFKWNQVDPNVVDTTASYNPVSLKTITDTRRYLGNNAIGSYAKGGYHTDELYGNAELEDQEIYRTPYGEMEKVNGKTHAQGGELYNLPQNTEILGKNIAPNGKSYKKNGDRLLREFNKYTKILQDKPTSLAKKTATLMLDKIQTDFSNLMDMQEMEKNYLLTPDETMEYACGGKVKKHKTGGWIQKAINPKHKGYCTPMTKSTCTPRRKALAMTFKKHHGFHANGGMINNTGYLAGTNTDRNPYNIIPSNYITTEGMSRPIYAYSNTGDNRVLYPNTGNYKFGGQYVTETPMYQSGGTTNNVHTSDYFRKKNLEESMRRVTGKPVPPKTKSGDVYITNFPNREFLDDETVRLSRKFFNPDEFNTVIETRQGAPAAIKPLQLKSNVGTPRLPGSASFNYNNLSRNPIERTRFIDEEPTAWYNKVADYAGQYAPIAYNLYQGLFGKADKMDQYRNPYESQIRSLMRNRKYNIEPELEANRLSTADYYRNLRGAAPSQGRYLAGLQSGQIGKQRADAEAYARKQNVENQYRAEEAQSLMGLARQDYESKMTAEDYNRRSKAAQRAYIPTALSQLQQQTQTNRILREKERLMRNKALRDEERQRIMEEYFKGYDFNLGGR